MGLTRALFLLLNVLFAALVIAFPAAVERGGENQHEGRRSLADGVALVQIDEEDIGRELAHAVEFAETAARMEAQDGSSAEAKANAAQFFANVFAATKAKEAATTTAKPPEIRRQPDGENPDPQVLLSMADALDRKGVEWAAQKRKSDKMIEAQARKQARVEKQAAARETQKALAEKRRLDAEAQAAAEQRERDRANAARQEQLKRQQLERKAKLAPVIKVGGAVSQKVSNFVKKNLSPKVLAMKAKNQVGRVADSIKAKREAAQAEKATRDRLASRLKVEEMQRHEKLVKRAEQQKEWQLKEEAIKEAQKEKERQKLQEKQQKVDSIREAMAEKRKLLAWARLHYSLAPAGQDCPEGFLPVTSLTACKMAQSVIGGIDDLDFQHTWPSRPGGCFKHVLNNHVNFNPVAGKVNPEDRRFCELIDEEGSAAPDTL